MSGSEMQAVVSTTVFCECDRVCFVEGQHITLVVAYHQNVCPNYHKEKIIF